jgi:hypothetical protein
MHVESGITDAATSLPFEAWLIFRRCDALGLGVGMQVLEGVQVG